MSRPRIPLPHLALVAASVVVLGCGAGKSAPRPEAALPLSVGVETVSLAASSDGLEAIGSIEPLRRASPGTILAGRITQIAKHEGDRVRRGDLLARVESGDVAARVAQAEAAVVAARAGEDNSRRMTERLERLVQKQAASPKSLEDATAGHEAALANLHAAEEGVSAARVMLGYGEVKAPFDGVVVKRLVEEGDTASPGMPMFVVEDTARLKIEAALPDAATRGLAPGAPVRVTVDGAPEDRREATIAEILPASDPATRTATVRVLLDNPGAKLRPGMFARLRFPGEGPDAVFVPAGAVIRRGPLTGVFVVDGGIARLRFVTLGRADGGRVEAATGLNVGERIVTSPPAELADGRRIELTR